MAGKFFFIDTTRCTACRGCQIACKQYKKHGVTKTKQYGSYQNPLDLDGNTFRLVRFSEHPSKQNSMVWYFFTEACRLSTWGLTVSNSKLIRRAISSMSRSP
jgi:formate dehydrogenase iron-sulfur subunit